MVYFDSTAIIDGVKSEIRKQKGLFNNSSIGKNSPYKLFGSILDGTK